MSRWNHPAYDLADKIAVAAIVAVFITLYAVTTGSPMTGSVFVAASASAVLAVAAVYGFARGVRGGSS